MGKPDEVVELLPVPVETPMCPCPCRFWAESGSERQARTQREGHHPRCAQWPLNREPLRECSDCGRVLGRLSVRARCLWCAP